MGTEWFELKIVFRLIFESLRIYDGVGFCAKFNFAVFSFAGITLLPKTASVRLKSYFLAFISQNHIFMNKTPMGLDRFIVQFRAIFFFFLRVDQKVVLI